MGLRAPCLSQTEYDIGLIVFFSELVSYKPNRNVLIGKRTAKEKTTLFTLNMRPLTPYHSCSKIWTNQFSTC